MGMAIVQMGMAIIIEREEKKNHLEKTSYHVFTTSDKPEITSLSELATNSYSKQLWARESWHRTSQPAGPLGPTFLAKHFNLMQPWRNPYKIPR